MNASRQLSVSTLYRGVTSHCLDLGGHVTFAWGVALPEGKASTGSGEEYCCLGLGVGSGVGGAGAAGVGTCSEEEAHCDGLYRRVVSTCPINAW